MRGVANPSHILAALKIGPAAQYNAALALAHHRTVGGIAA